ncbi:MAG: hypothetical protein KC776_33310 [Myxococcales bacterium]|nr:hypothetical protein [Myxococcales bacterium]MCB9575816.1 hypothetical protein [Polyangiaceae bacterium]
MPAPSRALLGAAALTIIALPHWAYAAEPQSPATASFALIPEPAPTAETFPAPPPTPAQAPAPVVDRGEPTNPRPEPVFAPAPVQSDPVRDTAPAEEAKSGGASDQWMLSLEGVTRIPVDVGGQIIFETPIGLRFGGGYGAIPSAYVNVVTGAASNASGSDLSIFDGGHVWRAQIGMRPIPKLGFYLDAGYAKVTLNGSVDPASFGTITGVTLYPSGVTTTLDMWFAELGYQGHVGDRVVLGLGVGLMGTMSSSTQVDEPSQNTTAQALTAEATNTVDQQIERYGFIPNLTLRLGFDLL